MPIEEQSIKNRDDLTIQDLRVNDLISSGDKRYIVVSPYFGNCVHVMDDDTLERREFYASEPFKLITYLGEPIICEGEWETRTGRKVSVVRNHLEHRIAFPFMYDLNDESNRRVFLAHTRHGSTPAFDIGSLRPPQASKDSREFEVGQVWKTRSGQEATIRRVLRNGNLECFLHSTNKKESLSANWLGMSTRSQDDLVEYLRESEIRYLQVGKRYRKTDGEIVTIVSENPYKCKNGVAYGEFGFARAFDSSIVSLVEDEPKQRPAFAIGQVWRLADGQEATVVGYDKQNDTFLLVNGLDSEWFCSNGMVDGESERGIVAVEYLRETESPRLEVGKTYRKASGEIVKIVDEDGGHVPFRDDKFEWYYRFGLGVEDPIVALVEEEPAKAEQPAEEPKQRPAFALGQVWRISDGKERTVVAHDKQDNTFFLMNNDTGQWLYPDGSAYGESGRGVVAVEYLRETDRPRIEVGKKYRTASGKIVSFVEDDGSPSLRFRGDDGKWYRQFGFSTSGDHIVALVEEELANPKQKEKQKGTEVVTETSKSKKNRSVGTPIHYTELQPGDLVRVKYDDNIWIEAYVDVTGEDGANYINRDTDLNISDCEDEVRLLQRGALPKLRVGQQWQRVDGEVVTISKANADAHFFTERSDCYTTIFNDCDESKDLEVCLNQNTLHSDESYEVIKLNDSIILFDKKTQQEIIASVESKNILQTLSNFATAVCGEPIVLAPLSSIKIIEK